MVIKIICFVAVRNFSILKHVRKKEQEPKSALVFSSRNKCCLVALGDGMGRPDKSHFIILSYTYLKRLRNSFFLVFDAYAGVVYDV